MQTRLGVVTVHDSVWYVHTHVIDFSSFKMRGDEPFVPAALMLASPNIKTLRIRNERNVNARRDLLVRVVVIGVHGPGESGQKPRQKHASNATNASSECSAALST